MGTLIKNILRPMKTYDTSLDYIIQVKIEEFIIDSNVNTAFLVLTQIKNSLTICNIYSYFDHI